MRFLSVFILVSFQALCQNDSSLELSVQTGHSGKINGLLIDEKNQNIISAGDDSKIVFWDITSGKQIDEIIAHEKNITALAFYQDSLIISGSLDKTLKIWSIQTKKLIKTIGPFEYPVKSLAVHSSTHQIVVGTRRIHLIDTGFNVTTLQTLSYDSYDAVHIMEGSHYIVYGGKNDKFTYILRNQTLDIIKTISISATSIESKDNELVISGNHGKLYYYNFNSKKEKSYALHSEVVRINDIQLGDDNIIFSRSDGIIECIKKDNFTTVDYFKGHLTQPTKVVFHKDQRFFVSSDVDGNILRWDLRNKNLSQVFSSQASPINHCVFTASGEEMLIGYSNGVLRKINLMTNNIVSNRIYFSDEIRRKGWQYTILSFKKVNEQNVIFHALKTKKLESNPNLLSFCEVWEGEWNLETNKIRLTKEIRKKETQTLIKQMANGKNINWRMYFLDHPYSASIDSTSELLYNQERNEIELYKNLKLQQSMPVAHNDFISGIAYNPRFNIGISYSWDGAIRFYDPDSLHLLPKLYLLGQRDFIWINEESYYFSSKGALSAVAFNWNNIALPYDQFDIKFNRPDIIYAELPFLESDFIDDLKKAYYKRLKKLGINSIEEIKISRELPQIQLHIPEKNNFEKKSVELAFNAVDKNVPINKVEVYINGVPQQLAMNFKPRQQLDNIPFEITLTPGDNYVEVIAINENNKKSLKQGITLTYEAPKQKPDLYIAAVGISKYYNNKFNLTYASKDAGDMIATLSDDKIYNKIHHLEFLDSNATFKNIQKIRSFIAQAKPNDVVILFAAGHGVLDENFDYYFAAADMSFSNPEENGVPFDWFDETLLNTASRKKLLILDACHSGEIDKEEVKVKTEEVTTNENINFRVAGTAIQNKNDEEISAFQLSRMLFADTRKSNGATVISSASGTEYAIEGKKWNNGVFTYAFLEGLTSKSADLNRDGIILISEIQTYINTKVYNLTNGQQSPNTRVENLKSDFRLW